ncbi:hypothetical protein AYX14_06359 [Cryptococcus neoformans]|nr:hypothetical protein AYX14_06359 [Cryptococcus neoformans var. grubii]
MRPGSCPRAAHGRSQMVAPSRHLQPHPFHLFAKAASVGPRRAASSPQVL